MINKSSQVIMVRDGQRTVITMSNDFSGSVDDFAMVVPVPTVLEEDDIRVAKQEIFDKLDAYSMPRMAEYYDGNPCEIAKRKYLRESMFAKNQVFMNTDSAVEDEEDFGVTIEATYTVGEYDILILSAEQSDGLESWLVSNGYKIPDNAKEVLEPYIKSAMKFFVVKVNLEEQKKSGFQALRPLQITFESQRFMLPIRLGMANAEKVQDLVIYSYTRNGATESTNYRTVKIASDEEVPIFIQDRFNEFYQKLFTKQWEQEGKNVVFNEYAWDLSSSNYTKCDPCASTPPNIADLEEAGVWWLNSKPQQWGSSNYEGDLFLTRLHVRYDRKHFPQDLMFQATPNKMRHQGRYVIRHAYSGDLSCDEGKAYIEKVIDRRKKELQTLASLTGWNIGLHGNYITEWQKKHPDYSANPIVKKIKSGGHTPKVLDKPDPSPVKVVEPEQTDGVDNSSEVDTVAQSSDADSLASSSESVVAKASIPGPDSGNYIWLFFLIGVPVVLALWLGLSPPKKSTLK